MQQQPTMNADTLLTSGQVARILRVCKTSVIDWTRQGHLKASLTPGKHRRYTLREVVRFAGVYDL